MPAKATPVSLDYFSDYSLLGNPYAYFEQIRALGPVALVGDPPVAFVTGFDEAVTVLNDSERFSSLISATGPRTRLPFVPMGDDITGQIAANRDPASPLALLVTYDGREHTYNRGLVARLLTPYRLKANQEFMRRYASRAVAAAVAEGRCELIDRIAAPFVTSVIADLLGVPEADRIRFKDCIRAAPPAGSLEDVTAETPAAPLQYMFEFFWTYLSERRESPRDDVMSELAQARYPDGSEPPIIELVKASMFLFAAGQDTAALLIGNSLRYLSDHPELQQRLREEPTLIPKFIEEMMRLEGSLKMTSRITAKSTSVGGVALPAGTPVAVILAAANRDARMWQNSGSFDLERPQLKQQIGFSRGPHTCLGAPLARAEVAIMLEEFLQQTASIAIDERQHGPLTDRHYLHVPSFMNHGVKALHLTLTPRTPSHGP